MSKRAATQNSAAKTSAEARVFIDWPASVDDAPAPTEARMRETLDLAGDTLTFNRAKTGDR